jgi:hypothetical protein
MGLPSDLRLASVGEIFTEDQRIILAGQGIWDKAVSAEAKV